MARRRIARLGDALDEIAAVEGEWEGVELDPQEDVVSVSEFAYYMAYADAIRTTHRAECPSNHLEAQFRAYAKRYLLHPNFNVQIKDLEDLGVDLFWYPHPARLLRPGEASPQHPSEAAGSDEEGVGESGAQEVGGDGGSGGGGGARGPKRVLFYSPVLGFCNRTLALLS